jgi:hypothetical protein
VNVGKEVDTPSWTLFDQKLLIVVTVVGLHHWFNKEHYDPFVTCQNMLIGKHRCEFYKNIELVPLIIRV